MEHIGRPDKPSNYAAYSLVSSDQTIRSKFSEFHSKLNWLT